MDIEKTICFTGHRIITGSKSELKAKTYKLIKEAIDIYGYRHFICGGAIGFDTIAAEIILECREMSYPLITLEIAIPCINQDKNWSWEDKKTYADILDRADKKTLVGGVYTYASMQRRNEYMVNASSVVIAYFNGMPSGTKNTLLYASQQGKIIWNIN